MLLLPIGHDEGVQRLPILTGLIIVACTLVHVQSIPKSPNRDRALELIKSYRAELEGAKLRGISDAEFFELHQQVQQGKFDQDPLYQRAIDRLESMLEVVRHPWTFVVNHPLSKTLLLYSFVHGGWWHLISNMLLLYVAGASIEDRWGRIFFVMFYSAAAVVAALAYQSVHAGSRLGLVGASGSIAGMMGAFLVCYWRTRFRFLFFYLLGWRTFFAPAWVYLGIWIALEAFNSWHERSLDSGVAHSAHVGGFALGVAVALAMKALRLERWFLTTDRFFEEKEEATRRDPSRDSLVHARHLAEHGSTAEALSKYREAAAENANNVAVIGEFVEFALGVKHHEGLQNLLDPFFAYVQRKDGHDRVLEEWERLNSIQLDTYVGQRGLACVAQSAISLRNPAVVHDIVRRIRAIAPKAPVLPGILWKLAEDYGRAGDNAKQVRVLEALAEEFPMDPFGSRAFGMLHQSKTT